MKLHEIALVLSALHYSSSTWRKKRAADSSSGQDTFIVASPSGPLLSKISVRVFSLWSSTTCRESTGIHAVSTYHVSRFQEQYRSPRAICMFV